MDRGAVWNSFHPDPSRKLSANLYDIYHCCLYNWKTPDNGQRSCLKLVPSWSCPQAFSKPLWHIPLLFVQLKSTWWRAEELSETRSILILLASCQQTCMTYTIAVCTVEKHLMTDRWTVRNSFHPDPAHKLSVNLYDIYHCYLYSLKTPDDGQRNFPKLAPSWSCSQAVSKPVWHIPLLYVQLKNTWWRTDELSETRSILILLKNSW